MALWLSQWPLPSQRHGRCPAYLAEFLPSEIESADSQKSMPSRVLTQEGLRWQLAGGGPYLPSPPDASGVSETKGEALVPTTILREMPRSGLWPHLRRCIKQTFLH